MKTIPEQVKKLLNDQSVWYIATCSDTPNAVPVVFKQVAEDGTLILADVFMRTTQANIEANGKIAISACDGTTMEGYQIKGTAVHLSEGPVVEACKAMVEGATKGGLHAKGAVVVTPEEIIVTTPGPENNRTL